jgi:hypothetical protein
MITITILAVVFIAGVITGIVALLRVGIAREEADRSLLRQPPTRAAAATRRVVGWHGSTPANLSPLRRAAKPLDAVPSR